MSSLDEQLALFEKEVLSSVDESKSQPDVKPKGPIQAADIGGSSHSSAAQPVKFVPHQLRVGHAHPAPPSAAATNSGGMMMRPQLVPMMPAPPVVSSVIESGPTLYAQPAAPAKSSSSTRQQQPESSSSTSTSSTSMLQPLPFKTLALPSDVELLAAKKTAAKAHENSYLGAVLRGEKKMKRFVRSCGGQVWEDPSMAEWDPSDFRIFCGDLGNEVSDELLAKAFRKYPSFQKAKVVRDSRTNKSKGFGFVSFKHQDDFIRAMKEMDGKYVGNRPIKLRKSNWKERNLDVVKKKNKEKKKLGLI